MTISEDKESLTRIEDLWRNIYDEFGADFLLLPCGYVWFSGLFDADLCRFSIRAVRQVLCYTLQSDIYSVCKTCQGARRDVWGSQNPTPNQGAAPGAAQLLPRMWPLFPKVAH